MGTLQEDLEAAGLPTEHHETDLYCPDTPQARAIVVAHGRKIDGWNVQRFVSAIDGKPWLDIPFAYQGDL